MTTARKGARLTPEQWLRARTLFESAIELPEKERAAWLVLQCADDEAVRSEAEQLLAAVAGDSILDSPIGILPTVNADEAPTSLAGRRLGPWKVIEAIGRGGMGEVWLAERADGAYEQRVAIKLLKRGLDTDLILDRFLRERRILARLSHPNIARLIDAGATDDGRPYLVMEHIDGQPITQWCRDRGLDLKARLTLFEQICEAVHAAHRQQIVHRDLKPSNVMVASDGEVKLLDFGIAKLVDDDDATQTSFGSTPATLHYGAPEQLLGQPVTTASDVYSLGVILYELLTGELPHRHTSLALALHAAAQDHLAATRPSIALRRGNRGDLVIDARARQIEAEIDWIVLKALQRDPARRYRTAAEMADDVRRFLDHRPVLARPDSFLYRAGRFVRRHRVGVAAVVITVVSLLTGLTAALWQAQRAEHEANRAEQVKALVVSMFEQSNPRVSQRKDIPVRELLDRGAAGIAGKLGKDPITQADLYEALAEIELGILDVKQAVHYADLCLELRRRYLPAGDTRIADILDIHGGALQQLQQFENSGASADQVLDRATADLEEADLIYSRAEGDHRLQRARNLTRLAKITSDRGKDERALALHEQSYKLFLATLGPRSADTLNERVNYADELSLNGQRDTAIRELRSAIDGLLVARGPDHTDVATAEDRLARTLFETGQYEESEQAMSKAIAINTRVFGDKDQLVAAEHVQRGLTQAILHRFGKADADFDSAGPALRPGTYPEAQFHDFHSSRFALQERYPEAAEEMRLASADYRLITASGETQPWAAQSDQGLYTAEGGNAIEGERLVRDAIGHLVQIASEETGDVGDARRNLGIVLALRGRVSESESEMRQALKLYQAFMSKEDTAEAAEFRYWIADDLLEATSDSSKLAEARDLAQQVLRIQRTSREPVTVAESLILAGRADRACGDSQRANAEFGEAASILRSQIPLKDAQLGAGTAVPSHYRYDLASTLAALGDPAAGPLFDEAVAGLLSAAPDHYLLGNVLLERARWRLAHGDSAGARKDQAAAIAAIMKNQGADSIYLARARALPTAAGS